MRNQMKIWQLVMGCVICLGIISSMFMSRITVSSGRMIDCVMNIANDMADQYREKIEDDDWGEDIEDALEDRKEDLKEDVEEALGSKKITRSSAQLMLASKRGVEKFLQDLSGKEEFDSDKEKEMVDKLHGALFWPRVMLIVIYVLPILLIVLYILTYLRGWKNLLAVVSTWVYFLLAAVSNLVWYIFIPSIGAKKLADVVGNSAGGFGFAYSMIKGSIKDILSSAIRHMLVSFTGLGIWIFTIGSVLLLVYSFLLMLAKNKAPVIGMRDGGAFTGDSSGMGDGLWDNGNGLGNDIFPAAGSYQDIPIMEDVGQNDNSNMMTHYGGEEYPAVQGMVSISGKIRITRGTMAGAEITCMPGEQIVVGRDPAVSDLILSHAKVSRKHFVIQYTEETDQYEIFCFSDNGIYLSSGGKIGKGQHANLARGTGIMMADGEEAMSLE